MFLELWVAINFRALLLIANALLSQSPKLQTFQINQAVKLQFCCGTAASDSPEL